MFVCRAPCADPRASRRRLLVSEWCQVSVLPSWTSVDRLQRRGTSLPRSKVMQAFQLETVAAAGPPRRPLGRGASACHELNPRSFARCVVKKGGGWVVWAGSTVPRERRARSIGDVGAPPAPARAPSHSRRAGRRPWRSTDAPLRRGAALGEPEADARKSSTRLQCARIRRYGGTRRFGRASRTRRERTIRPKISRNDGDRAERRPVSRERGRGRLCRNVPASSAPPRSPAGSPRSPGASSGAAGRVPTAKRRRRGDQARSESERRLGRRAPALARRERWRLSSARPRAATRRPRRARNPWCGRYMTD